MKQLIHETLPHPDVMRQNFGLDEDGNVLWSETKRSAVAPGMFGTDDLVILGWFVMRASDASQVLQFGSWPIGADNRPEPHVNRMYVYKASTLMDRNNTRRELNAAERDAA